MELLKDQIVKYVKYHYGLTGKLDVRIGTYWVVVKQLENGRIHLYSPSELGSILN